MKVPSFPDDVAMALIEEELGQPWNNIYSELSSSPIAAGKVPKIHRDARNQICYKKNLVF